jgi:hypothetical protein
VLQGLWDETAHGLQVGIDAGMVATRRHKNAR